MPPKEWKLRIKGILQAITCIQDYTAGMSIETFKADELRVDGVIRNLAVIGEAAAHIPPSVQQRYPAVPWSEMRGMRNVVIHVYFGIMLDVLWDTVQSDLPALAPQLQDILDKE
ncbi:MAG: DUF86 domain-containing protein [Chloroflexi bacterium]|nr:DUF86 domain-containing protein [Chloroflexota bacterium]